MSADIPQALLAQKHFLSIRDLQSEVLKTLTEFSIRRKGQFQRGELKPMLAGKVLAMIFQKSSLRTRLAFETAMAQLGGHAVYLEDHQVGIGTRESVRDIARVISSMCNGIAARVTSHQVVVELAAASGVPVINALSDWAHPCQALSDVMTIQEHFGRFSGLKVAFIGDANNVARSLVNACAEQGVHFAIASPKGYRLEEAIVQWASGRAARTGGSVQVTEDPLEAAAEADVVYTDVWTSMGQESERADREKAFAAYQVNAGLMKRAKPNAVVMHCLPAIRNQEITDELVDGPQSLIFQQAENRLHSQRALLEVLLHR